MRTFIAMLTLLIVVGTARADVTEAKKHYERGMKSYNILDFKSALKEFQAAYVEQPDPTFLFNMAQCYRQLGEYDAASKSYRLYLANMADAPNRDQVKRLIDEMDAAAKEAHAKTPPTGTQPPATPAPVTAAAPVTVEAQPSAPPSRWYQSRAGWALGGSGIALAAVGAGLLGAALGEHDASANATTQAGFDEHHANAIHFQQAGWPLLGVGGALVVAGVTLFVLHAKGRR